MLRGFRWRQDCIFVNGDTCGDSCRQPAGKYLFYESIDQDWACRLWRIRRYAVDGAAPAEKPLIHLVGSAQLLLPRDIRTYSEESWTRSARLANRSR
jgi:hypothetical protein